MTPVNIKEKLYVKYQTVESGKSGKLAAVVYLQRATASIDKGFLHFFKE